MSSNLQIVHRYYWDADVLISYVAGIPGRVEILDDLLADAEKKQAEIMTSVLTITEVAYVNAEQAKKKLDPATEAKIELLWHPDSPIKLVEMHEGIARDARGLIRKAVAKGWGLRSADAIHLATASRLGVTEMHTYETKKLPRWTPLVGFKIREPHKAQGNLWAASASVAT